jgi:hypothetical protein
MSHPFSSRTVRMCSCLTSLSVFTGNLEGCGLYEMQGECRRFPSPFFRKEGRRQKPGHSLYGVAVEDILPELLAKRGP